MRKKNKDPNLHLSSKHFTITKNNEKTINKKCIELEINNESEALRKILNEYEILKKTK